MELERRFTVQDLATAWRKTPQWIREEIHSGRLEAFRVGPEFRISLQAIEKYESEHMAATVE